MEKLYLGNPSDAEVDALLSQLNDENLLKLKVNTHTSTNGLRQPIFADGWSTAEDDAAGGLDDKLKDRFSNLKLPIGTAKKAEDLDIAKKKDCDVAKRGDGLEVNKEEVATLKKLSSRVDSNRVKREGSSNLSHGTEFLSFRSDDLDDFDNVDGVLNERFRALKIHPCVAGNGNAGLHNLVQFSGQLSAEDYEDYPISFSTPASPSANLLGRSKSRSGPRVATTSVSTSCHCSAPSPLKLLKQVSSKKFPSKATALPPISPRSSNSPGSASGRTPTKSSGKEFKMQGFGNSKPIGKEVVKKGKSRWIDRDSALTSKDVRRLLSSVADRVGFERSRVSSAEEDDYLDNDLHVWSVLEREQEFVEASTQERMLNREAERVVEWAKDVVRLEPNVLDAEAETEDLEPGEEEEPYEGSNKHVTSEEAHKIVKSEKSNIVKVKRWGFF